MSFLMRKDPSSPNPFFQGTQFDLKEDWGEQLISKSCPVLAVLDVTNDEIKVLDGVPDYVSAGQVRQKKID